MPKGKRSRRHKRHKNKPPHPQQPENDPPPAPPSPNNKKLHQETPKRLSRDSIRNNLNPTTPLCRPRVIHGSPSIIRNPIRSPKVVNFLNHESTSEIQLNQTPERRIKFRSNSSIPKLHSPGLEKIPLKADVGVQTYFETPKLVLLDYLSPSVYQTPLKRMSHNEITPIYDLSQSKREIEHKALKTCGEKLATDGDKEMSATEMSFFTPQLYGFKPASTPMVGKQCNTDPHLFTIGATTGPYRTIQRRRSYKSASPKFHKYFNYVRYCRNRNFDLANSSLKPTVNFSADECPNSGSYMRLLSKIKRYHSRYSSKWSSKILEICSWLGVTIRKGLSSICKLYSLERPFIETATLSNCSCAHNAEISVLKMKIAEMNVEILNMRLELERHKNDNTGLEGVKAQLAVLQGEIGEVADIKKQLQEIKQQLSVRGSAPPPPGLPPPPPPPPPPMPVFETPTSRPFKSGRKSEKKGNENIRPIISLEDILKVKLRKTGEKPSMKKSNQPFVSTEMLRQVKLRPASRPQTPSSINSTLSSLATSPHSSLTRILSSVDTNVRKVHRFARTSIRECRWKDGEFYRAPSGDRKEILR